MKLIRCHIENFGTLHDFDYDFSEGINVIHKENGWGKSTFASFIRVMFYGFDRETKKAVEERERVQKCPWQGGVYGGSLVFEAHGKTYRLERTFDERKPAKDTFALYDETTGLPSRDYQDPIGEALFDIDSDSFQKTVYIGQLDCLASSTDQIHARIGSLSHETADMAEYEKALSDLHARINYLSDTRVTGLCHKLKQQIGELEAQTAEKPYRMKQSAEILTQMEETARKIDETQQEIHACDAQMHIAAKASERLAEWKVYENRKEELRQLKQRVSQEEEWFPSDIPSLQQTEDILALTRKMESRLARCESLALTSREKLTLSQFERVFSAGVPGTDLLSIVSANVAEYELVHKEISDSSLSENEMEQLRKGRRIFGDKQVNEEELSRMPELWKHCEKQKEALETLQKEAQQLEKEKKIIWILATAVVIVGAILMMLQQVLPAVVCAVMAVCLGIYGSTKKGDTGSMEQMQQKLLSDQKQLDDFLQEYDLDGNSCPECFYTLAHTWHQWMNLEKRYQSCMDVRMSSKEKTLYARLQNFFMPIYGKTDDFRGRLDKLHHDISEYDALVEKRDRFMAERKQLQADMHTCRSFCLQYGFVVSDDLHEQVTRIRDHILSLQEAKKTAERHQKQLDEFLISHDICADAKMESVDLHSLQATRTQLEQQKQALTTALNGLMQQKQQSDETVDSLQMKEKEVQDKKQEREMYLHQLQVLENTASFLQKARNSFTARYRKPLLLSFDRWYALLSGNDQKQYEIDADLNIRMVAYGRGRNVNTLSEGYRDLIGLCRRMAMIDAMYEKEKPFVILDDPFINLDDERLACGQQFVNAIAEHCQVIYMTCHAGRTVQK